MNIFTTVVVTGNIVIKTLDSLTKIQYLTHSRAICASNFPLAVPCFTVL